MRKVIGVLLVGVVPFVLGPTVAAQAHASHPSIVRAHVKIVNFKFKPGVLSIQKGTKVIWKNTTTSTTHTSTSDNGVWDSGPIAPGTKFHFVFKNDGTFTYHCSIHPFMTAEIDVSG